MGESCAIDVGWEVIGILCTWIGGVVGGVRKVDKLFGNSGVLNEDVVCGWMIFCSDVICSGVIGIVSDVVVICGEIICLGVVWSDVYGVIVLEVVSIGYVGV